MLLDNLASAAVGGLIGLASALVVASHNARAAAGAELRAAFAPELPRMRSTQPAEWVFDGGEDAATHARARGDGPRPAHQETT